MDQRVSALTIDLRPGECLQVSGPAVVELIHKSGHLARLRVKAPREVQITKVPAEKPLNDVASMTE